MMMMERQCQCRHLLFFFFTLLLAFCHCQPPQLAGGHSVARHHYHHNHHHDHPEQQQQQQHNDRTLSDLSSDCGADHPTPQELDQLQAILQEAKQHQPSVRASSSSSTTTTTTTPPPVMAIPVFVHIILQSDGQTHTTGLITDHQVTETIRLLNDAYHENATPFYFYLAQPPQRVVNFVWYGRHCQKQVDTTFKMALHQGGSDALNLYVCDTTLSGYLGWATYPWRLSDDRVPPQHDGAVISYKAVYNEKNDNDKSKSNSGAGAGGAEFVRHTLTHEVGHWLGLWHTYENGCDGNGDGVEDTPSHLPSKTNCTLPNQDTCVDALYATYNANFDLGLDPRNNYMDTNNEECRSEFTPGQVRRMMTMFQTFRMTNRTNPDFVPPPLLLQVTTEQEHDEEDAADSDKNDGGSSTTGATAAATTDNLGRADCTLAGGTCAASNDCCQTEAQPLMCAESLCVAVAKMNLDADSDKDDSARLFDENEGQAGGRGGVRHRRRRLKGSRMTKTQD